MSQGAVWYVACRGQQHGPHDPGQIIGLIRSGHVDATASVSAPHKPGWNPITGEPMFAPHLPTARPPAATPYGGAAPYGGQPPQVGQPAYGGHPRPGGPSYGGGPPSHPGTGGAYPSVRGASQVPSGKGLRIAGWILLGIAAFFLLMIPLMAMDESAEPNTWMGALMVVAMFGIPGGILMWRGRKAAAKARLVGFLTSRNRIQVPEVARMIKKPELETEQLLAELNQELGLDLIYAPDERQYLHRSRLSTTHAIPEKCPTCGAPTQNQLVLQGERVTCKYCDAIMA